MKPMERLAPLVVSEDAELSRRLLYGSDEARSLEGVERPVAGRGEPSLGSVTMTWTKPTQIKLLSGGNPQIPKGDGDAPVRAYIEAVPGWKQGVIQAVDRTVGELVPGVERAVRWNSPFWAYPGRGFFLSVHCLTKYVKLTFFDGESLDPMPPGNVKAEGVRVLDVHEDDELDLDQLARWIQQAEDLPGWRP